MSYFHDDSRDWVQQNGVSWTEAINFGSRTVQKYRRCDTETSEEAN